MTTPQGATPTKHRRMALDGYTLHRAIQHQETLRDLAQAEFPTTTTAFPLETKPAPDEVMKRLTDAEYSIAALQAVLGAYNQRVRVTLAGGERISLAEAVKRVGGTSRIEKHWRKALSVPDYGYPSEKEEGKTYAVQTLSTQEMQQRALAAAKIAAGLRQAINQANSTKITISVDPSLLAGA